MTRISRILSLALLFTISIHAKERVVARPLPVDALGIGSISGSAISGTVAMVSGTIITLNTGAAPEIRIDATHAKFAGRDGAQSIADVKPGTRITAFIGTAPVVAGAALVAQLINIEPPPPDLAIAGPIESIDVAGSKFVVLGVTISVDSSTRFSSAFPTFAPIRGLGDLLVGQTVLVDASPTAAAILARSVLVVSPTRDEVIMLRGKVKSITDKSWVITESNGQDRTILVDEHTKIGGAPAVGDEVQVLARVDSASNVIALAILELGTHEEKVVFTGTVKTIGSTSWVITPREGTDRTVAVNAQTSITGSPAAGDQVEVIAIKDASGNLTATSIRKVTTDAKEIELRGFVKSIGADHWTIGGPPGSLAPEMIVKITPTTTLYASPAVGDQVVVTGTRDAAGILVARSIRKEEAVPLVVVVHGTIEKMTTDRWTLGGPTASPLPVEIRITHATLIYANPAVGDHVVVTGIRESPSTTLALKIGKE